MEQFATDPALLVFDAFCGAGGFTSGVKKARIKKTIYNAAPVRAAKVIACINHDALAIVSHQANNEECLHFTEDIRRLPTGKDSELATHVRIEREYHPTAKLLAHFSAECTNYSKAKGGMARDADSRTLPKCLYMHYNEETKEYEESDSYLQVLDPDYVTVENVEEFLRWGPERIKPKAFHADRTDLTIIKDKKTGELKYGYEDLPERRGEYYRQWVADICALGYEYEYRMLNSADFGAYTSRKRYFGMFYKPGLPALWPEQTHAKAPKPGSRLQKWKAVKDVLDFSDEGESIFTRKKPLSEKTLERVYAGLVKYVTKGDKSFLQKHFSGRPAGKVTSTDSPAGTITTSANQSLIQTTPLCMLKYNSTSSKGVHVPPSLDEPSPVVSTQGRLGIIGAQFLSYYYSNGNQNSTVDDPAGTLTTKDRMQLVIPEFLANTYSGGGQLASLEDPHGALTTVPKSNLVQCHWLDKQYGSGDRNHQSIEVPAGAVTGNPKLNMVQAWVLSPHFDGKGFSVDGPVGTITAGRKHHQLMFPQWGTQDCCQSVEQPSRTLIARMDKTMPQLIVAEESNQPIAIALYESDTPAMRKIKEFMAVYGIIDIKMRMLQIPELKKIMGFPEDYILKGTKADQKKFIGNAVEVTTAKVLVEALATGLVRHMQQPAKLQVA